jgi:hypothetical protein
MARDDKADDRDPAFSFGTRELRESRRAELLTLVEGTPKSALGPSSSAGFDPYNTSGSFDRRRHWERVGKRQR